MNYAASLNLAGSGCVKTLSHTNENIQDEYNYEFYMNSGNDLTSHSLTTQDNSFRYFTLDDTDDNYFMNSKLIKIASNNCSIKPDLDNTVRKYFMRQLFLQAKLPTERALRSDILLI